MSEQPPPPPPPPSYTPPPAMPPGGSSGYTPPPAMQQPYVTPAPGPRTDGMAIAALICGIVAFPGICCYGVPAIALGITAFFLGRRAEAKVKASGGTLGGEGMAKAGWICGIVAAVIGALVLIVVVGGFLITMIASSSGALETPTP